MLLYIPGCIAGYYGTYGNTCTACPTDTFLAAWTSGTIMNDCTPCNLGYTTSGGTGQTACSGK